MLNFVLLFALTRFTQVDVQSDRGEFLATLKDVLHESGNCLVILGSNF